MAEFCSSLPLVKHQLSKICRRNKDLITSYFCIFFAVNVYLISLEKHNGIIPLSLHIYLQFIRLHIGAYVVCLLLGYPHATSASIGDTSFVYQRCLAACQTLTCDNSIDTREQPPQTDFKPYVLTFPERVVKWSCVAECRYHCMWRTVDAFREDKQEIPQFHGKVS